MTRALKHCSLFTRLSLIKNEYYKQQIHLNKSICHFHFLEQDVALGITRKILKSRWFDRRWRNMMNNKKLGWEDGGLLAWKCCLNISPCRYRFSVTVFHITVSFNSLCYSYDGKEQNRTYNKPSIRGTVLAQIFFSCTDIYRRIYCLSTSSQTWYVWRNSPGSRRVILYQDCRPKIWERASGFNDTVLLRNVCNTAGTEHNQTIWFWCCLGRRTSTSHRS